MSTTDGRILVSNLKSINLLLENLLNPLSPTKMLSVVRNSALVQENFYSSILSFGRPDKILPADENGALKRFRAAGENADGAMDLTFVTANSLLMLARIESVKNHWQAEILVEDVSLLSIAFTLLSKYVS